MEKDYLHLFFPNNKEGLKKEPGKHWAPFFNKPGVGPFSFPSPLSFKPLGHGFFWTKGRLLIVTPSKNRGVRSVQVSPFQQEGFIILSQRGGPHKIFKRSPQTP